MDDVVETQKTQETWREKLGATPLGRSLAVMEKLKEDPPPELFTAFIPKDTDDMTEGQLTNFAAITADEWLTKELGGREDSSRTPQADTKALVQRRTFNQASQIVGPYLENQQFMEVVTQRVKHRLANLTSKEKKLIETEFTTPTDPTEVLDDSYIETLVDTQNLTKQAQKAPFALDTKPQKR